MTDRRARAPIRVLPVVDRVAADVRLSLTALKIAALAAPRAATLVVPS